VNPGHGLAFDPPRLNLGLPNAPDMGQYTGENYHGDRLLARDFMLSCLGRTLHP